MNIEKLQGWCGPAVRRVRIMRSSIPYCAEMRPTLILLLFSCILVSCATSDSVVRETHKADTPPSVRDTPDIDEAAERPVEESGANDTATVFSGDDSSVSESLAARIDERIDEFVYLAVSFDANPDESERARMIVEAANAVLEEDDYGFVSWDHSYPLMRRSVRDGLGGMETLRRIGSMMKADVCLDIEVEINREGSAGEVEYKAEVTVSAVDTLTGDVRSDIRHVGERFDGEEDAVRNAVATAVRKTILTIRSRAFRELAGGIRYEVVIRNTSDSGLIDFFTSELEKKVISIVSRSYSKAETRYTLQMIGQASDVEDVVYDIAAKIPGLENMSLVFQQGNSLTFASGI